MLSRRSVRVKVMQLIYAMNRDESLTAKDIVEHYWKSVDESFEMFLFKIYTILQIAKVSEEDFQKRLSKHLPSDQDKLFKPVLWQNAMIQDLANNTKLQKRFEKLQFSSKIDQDHFKSIYYEFAKQENYIRFASGDPNHDEILEMLLELYRFCRSSELYNELIEDHYPNWEADKSLIIGAIKKVLKELPAADSSFFESHYPDKETTEEYGAFLLNKTLQEDQNLLQIIKPVLQNWDSDRVAVIDMILLKMAVAEFLYCKTIPPKVTLNEYVELAKSYSTSKSKEFINGILDKILDDLQQSGLLAKEGRGLMD